MGTTRTETGLIRRLMAIAGLEVKPLDPDPALTEVSCDTDDILHPDKDLTDRSQDQLSEAGSEMALPKPTKLVSYIV